MSRMNVMLVARIASSSIADAVLSLDSRTVATVTAIHGYTNGLPDESDSSMWNGRLQIRSCSYFYIIPVTSEVMAINIDL